MTSKLELIDVGGGNVGSVMRCLTRLGLEFERTSQNDLKRLSGAMVLPGVGHFGAVMGYLNKTGLAKYVVEQTRSGRPLLGICVGLQVLFEESEEAPGVRGLSLLEGKVVKFDQGKVPQIGWNKIVNPKDMQQEEFVYFVNSYYAIPRDKDIQSYIGNYHVPFCAAVASRNITAFQFHPEKSGEAGERLLKAWAKSVSN